MEGNTVEKDYKDRNRHKNRRALHQTGTSCKTEALCKTGALHKTRTSCQNRGVL